MADRDVFDSDKRHRVMASIKGKNSEAELLVFRYMAREKIYFQRHYMRVPGSPDLALPRKKRAVFIDGDFWHGHDYESRVKPRLYTDWWRNKIKGNMERDARQNLELSSLGWTVFRVWESDILRKRTRNQTLEQIKLFLKS
jgi:DNA mismatch endonuclease (patch repair protein)